MDDKKPQSSRREPPPSEFHFNTLKSARDHYIEYKTEVIDKCKTKQGAVNIDFIKVMAKSEVQ